MPEQHGREPVVQGCHYSNGGIGAAGSQAAVRQQGKRAGTAAKPFVYHSGCPNLISARDGLAAMVHIPQPHALIL